jgi:hypothetical protein
MSCPLKRFPVKAKTIGDDDCNPEKVKEINDLYTKMLAERDLFDKKAQLNTEKVETEEKPMPTTKFDKTSVPTTENDPYKKMLEARKRQDQELNKFFSEDEYNALNGKGPASNS